MVEVTTYETEESRNVHTELFSQDSHPGYRHFRIARKSSILLFNVRGLIFVGAVGY
jgi:hypothetical protein